MMETLLDLIAQGFPSRRTDGDDRRLSRPPPGALAGRRRRGLGGTPVRRSVGDPDGRVPHLGRVTHPQLEMGIERARALGRTLEVGYMRDQFGHIGQMPQILRLAGIKRAMVWRGVPSAIGTSTLRWRSPDGSELLAASLPLGYSSGSSLLRTDDPESLARVPVREVERLRRYAPDGCIVVMVGYDHAGPGRDASVEARGCTAAGGSGRADRQRRVARAGARDEPRPAGLDTPCTRRSPRL